MQGSEVSGAVERRPGQALELLWLIPWSLRASVALSHGKCRAPGVTGAKSCRTKDSMVHRRRKADPIGAVPPEQREVTMYRLGSPARRGLTGRLQRPRNAHGTGGSPVGRHRVVDRPYTWTLTCSGDYRINVSWHWMQNGAWITSDYMDCPANGQSQLRNTGVRPANADGFTATVGQHTHTWTFDPAGPFTATLSGNQSGRGRGGWNPKEDGTLTVES